MSPQVADDLGFRPASPAVKSTRSDGLGFRPKKQAAPAAVPHETHGVSGSWTTPDPGALAGMRESAGIPSWKETKEFTTTKLPSYAKHPVDTARSMAKAIWDLNVAGYSHPIKFTEEAASSLANVPQFKRSIHEGHYFETSGLALGTAIQAIAALGGEEGWLAKATKAVKGTEEGQKALQEARAAQAIESPKIHLTLGERLKSPRMEKGEELLRGFPGVAGRFNTMVRERSQALLNFRDTTERAAGTLHQMSQRLYDSIETRVPGFQAIQDSVHDLRDARLRALRAGNDKAAFDITENLKVAEDSARKLVEKSGDKLAVDAWKRADNLWGRYAAKRQLTETVEDSIKGIKPGEQIIAAGREQEVQPGGLVERLKKLEKERVPGGNVLLRAMDGSEYRVKQLKSVASLLDRVSSHGRSYIVERVLGYAILGAIPLAPHNYIWDIAAGMAGGMGLASIMVRAGGSKKLEGFLRAVDQGEMARATRMANTLIDEHIVAEANKQAAEAEKARKIAARRVEGADVGSPLKTPGEPRAGLRVAEVPIQQQPGPFERPMEEQLTDLVSRLRAEGESGKELEQHLHDALEEEMEKIRQRSRTQGAMQQYRGR